MGIKSKIMISLNLSDSCSFETNTGKWRLRNQKTLTKKSDPSEQKDEESLYHDCIVEIMVILFKGTCL